MLKRLALFSLTISLLFNGQPVSAQSSGPVYIVQPGDALSSIAARFKVSLSDLMSANDISNANSISAGAQLTIPGLDGITGTLTTADVGYGDTLKSLSRRMQIPLDLMRRLNRITSPIELYAGSSLVYQQQDDSAKPAVNRFVLEPGESLLEASVKTHTDPWTLSGQNSLQGTWDGLPDDVLYAQGSPAGNAPANGLPTAFVGIDVHPLPITQGGTAEIVVQAQPGVQLSGLLVDRPLHFFPLGNNKYVALQGTYALLNPGSYPLQLEATLSNGSIQSFEQSVIIQSGNYPTDPLLSVSSDTIDPTVNDAETQQLTQLTSAVTPTQYWQGGFKNPSPDFPDCHPSLFGDRRNYVGQGTNETYHSFHSGLDFCGRVGTSIDAAADGVVVFTGMLTVHGNTTIIDHGWGIYSMYCHQSEFDVQVGQQVKAGDLIGKVGATGRVTGPHLHFEIWVNGIEVNPIDWLTNTYP